MIKYKAFSDAELVALLKENDRFAFNEIYRRYWRIMYLYARKLLFDHKDAEDVVQEVLAYIWTKREEIRITTSLRSYLYGSVRNMVLNMANRKKVIERYLVFFGDFIDKGDFVTDDYIRERELTLAIQAAVVSLPPRMRQIFELSRNEYMSQKNIAEKLNLSDKTVKKQISNALKLLRIKVLR
ncbi:RNA polymerase sigma factor [Pedobacter nutrimenti]|jgi:RNA polymerase sigma-70 factor (ECF subfamily)|uniref:RNA polymerase sigma-70 factor (ECF subfamily) n=1 Tax=Pedobacter nutrimenti TaxID=1241337 RepID=A0A318UIT1_9SPHI|nr:RNA polymerase sigma-70 factor [Pedobacter nutrimenti]PYF75470.1 RNA polymerase sigma-70 factor (ECF subfamily) [Pedobacter nutrimenti]|eukprot:gene4754-5541_t